jgi:hypothetical protein
VTVHYCGEQFENDGSPASTIIKSVKRTMAGEYSRELSSKVFQGACKLIQRGFKQGGTAGFGLRRMLVDVNGQHKAMLKIGEQKSIQTDRVVSVPGPEEEVEVVRWIYQAFLTDRKTESEIAAAQHPGHAYRFRPDLDDRHRPPGPHEREVHRQQRLSPHLFQTEAQARDESARPVDPRRRRLSGHRRPRPLFQGARNHPRPEREIHQ